MKRRMIWFLELKLSGALMFKASLIWGITSGLDDSQLHRRHPDSFSQSLRFHCFLSTAVGSGVVRPFCSSSLIWFRGLKTLVHHIGWIQPRKQQWCPFKIVQNQLFWFNIYIFWKKKTQNNKIVLLNDPDPLQNLEKS